MSNLRTHPQPLLLKREGAKTSFLKVTLFVREARHGELGWVYYYSQKLFRSWL